MSLWEVKDVFNKVKNAVLNLTEMEAKVREATNNDPWGASGTLMQEIAQGTYSYQHFNEIMSFIYRRFKEKEPHEWRQVYKSLTLLEYLIKNGSERVVDDCRSRLGLIRSLRSFNYIDNNGKDQGINVRNRANEIVKLLMDDNLIREERLKAKENRAKYSGIGSSNYRGKYQGFGNTVPPSMSSTSYDISTRRQATTTTTTTTTTTATTSSNSSTTAKEEKEPQKAPQKEVDLLLDLDDEKVETTNPVASSSTTTTTTVNLLDDDDEWGNFESASDTFNTASSSSATTMFGGFGGLSAMTSGSTTAQTSSTLGTPSTPLSQTTSHTTTTTTKDMSSLDALWASHSTLVSLDTLTAKKPDNSSGSGSGGGDASWTAPLNTGKTNTTTSPWDSLI